MEGSYHALLKEVVVNELDKEGYSLYVEPRESPLDRLMWGFYRPDVLGVSCGKSSLKIAIAECETNPAMRRMKGKFSKLRRSMAFQKRLGEEHNLRLLLVIPPNKLQRVNSSTIRRAWEIWIVNKKGVIIHTIPPFT